MFEVSAKNNWNAEHRLGSKHNIEPRRCSAFRFVALLFLVLFALKLHAEDQSLTNLFAQGDLNEKQGKPLAALKFFLAAEKLSPTNCEILCRITKQYCDLMYSAKSKDEEKMLARKALACAQRAVKADPKSAKAHLCVAVCCTKNFPFSDNQTKINFSKSLKAEAEAAIALDPTQDVSYYMLGRWHYEVANMNFIMRGLIKIAYGGLPKASNEDAIKNFKKAIELAPQRIIHHFELSKVYLTTGQKKLALNELIKCRDLKPIDRDDAAAQKDALKQLREIKATASSHQALR